MPQRYSTATTASTSMRDEMNLPFPNDAEIQCLRKENLRIKDEISKTGRAV